MRPGTYCELCKGTGCVSIWSHETIASLRRGDDPVRLADGAAACKCKLGDQYAFKRTRRGDIVPWLPRYDAESEDVPHVLRIEGEPERTVYDDIEEYGSPKLKAFVGLCAAEDMPNRVSEFDDWNNE